MTLIPTTLHGDNDAHRARRGAGAELTRDQLVSAYRTMLLSRRLDDKEIQLKRQNKIFFQISGAGHEAVLTAAGLVLRPGYDWFYPYYRDRALCLQLGMTPAEMLYEAVGAAADPRRAAGRCRATGDTRRSTSSRPHRPRARSSCRRSGAPRRRCGPSCSAITEGFVQDEVVYVSTGDGTTSEGEFWESLNTACNLKLPVVYLVEDNGYAISVPVEVNTPGSSISELVAVVPRPVHRGGRRLRPGRELRRDVARGRLRPRAAADRRSSTPR